MSANEDDLVRVCCGSLVDRLALGLCPFSLPLLLLLLPALLAHGPASSPPPFSQLVSASLSSRLRAPALGQAPDPAELKPEPPPPPPPPAPSRRSRRELPDLVHTSPPSSSRRSRSREEEPSFPHARLSSLSLLLSWRDDAPLAHGPLLLVSPRSCHPSPAPDPLLPLTGASPLSR